MALRRVIHLVSEPQTLILHHPSFLHHRIQCFTSPNLSKEKKIFRHHFSHLYLNCEVDFVSDPWIREENWEEMNAVMAIGAFSGAQLSSCAAFSSQSAGLNVGQSIVKIAPRSVAVRAAGMEATILVCKKFPAIFAESHTCTYKFVRIDLLEISRFGVSEELCQPSLWHWKEFFSSVWSCGSSCVLSYFKTLPYSRV